jgi:hypothetical protein
MKLEMKNPNPMVRNLVEGREIKEDELVGAPMMLHIKGDTFVFSFSIAIGGNLYVALAETRIKKGQPQQAQRLVQSLPGSRNAEITQVRLASLQGRPTVQAESKSRTERD